MAIELITGEDGKTALADTVEGVAFGPVFEQREHAEAFLEWASLNGNMVAGLRVSTLTGSSLWRTQASAGTWKHVYEQFFAQCIDADGQLV